MSDHLEVGVTDPVGNLISARFEVVQLTTHGGPGSGEEVVDDGDLVSEEHQSVDQVRSNESSSTGTAQDASESERGKHLIGAATDSPGRVLTRGFASSRRWGGA